MKVSQVLHSFPSLRGWPSPVDLNIHLIEGCEGAQSWRLGSIVRRNVKKKKKKKAKKPKSSSFCLVQILAWK